MNQYVGICLGGPKDREIVTISNNTVFRVMEFSETPDGEPSIVKTGWYHWDGNWIWDGWSAEDQVRVVTRTGMVAQLNEGRAS